MFFSLLLVLFVHIITCGWVGVSFIEERNWMSIKISSLHDGGENIAYRENNSWSDTWKVYILSLYFVIQTIATVGYGDVNPATSTERIISILLMLFGVIGFAFVSGTVSSIMLSLDENSSETSRKISRLRGMQKKYEKDGFNRELFLHLLKTMKTQKIKPESSWLLEEINAKSGLKKKVAKIVYKDFNMYRFI